MHDGTLPRCRRRIPALVLALSANAAAQQTPGIEEIIVSAQKRPAPLYEVAMPVSALDARSLRAAGVQTLNDVTRQVPALEVQTSTNPVSTSLRLRRVGNLGNIPTFEPAVGLFVDGAFRARSVYGSSELFDLERIEILRGPQSTLHGKNTTAGVLSLHTKAPPESFEIGAELTAGQIDGAQSGAHMQFRGRIGGPLTESVRAALGVASTTTAATFDEALLRGGEPGNDTGRYALRGNLLWGNPEGVEWRLLAGLGREDDRREMPDIHYDPAGPIATLVLPAWRAAGVSDTCTDNDPHNRVSCLLAAPTTDLALRELTLLGRHEFANGWTLQSVSSWDTMRFHGAMPDVAQMGAPLLQLHDTQRGESWQQELRLASAPGGRVEWLLGGFGYRNEHRRGDGARPFFSADRFSAHPAVSAANQRLLNLPAPLPLATPGQLGFLDAWQETSYLGLYGQATWQLSARTSVTAGARWQREQKDAGIRQWTNDPAPSVLSRVLAPAEISSSAFARAASKPTWTITPQWQPRAGLLWFATAASGFKSGGFNTGFGRLPLAQREFADEDVRHYEAGVKLAPSARWRVAANVFSTRYEQYQEAAFVGAQFTVGNAQKVELRGFETEGVLLLGANVSVDFALSRADMTYASHLSAPCFPGRRPDSPLNNGACNLSGGQPVNAPAWKTHAGVQYSAPLGFGTLNLRADWAWTDSYNTNFSGDPRLRQEAYDWVNLRAELVRGRHSLVLWVENATNVTVVNYDAVLTLYAGDGSFQSMLQSPRMIGITARIAY